MRISITDIILRANTKYGRKRSFLLRNEVCSRWRTFEINGGSDLISRCQVDQYSVKISNQAQLKDKETKSINFVVERDPCIRYRYGIVVYCIS